MTSETSTTSISKRAKDPKLWSDDICPVCGGKGKKVRPREWKCISDSSECEVLIYRPSNITDQILREVRVENAKRRHKKQLKENNARV